MKPLKTILLTIGIFICMILCGTITVGVIEVVYMLVGKPIGNLMLITFMFVIVGRIAYEIVYGE